MRTKRISALSTIETSFWTIFSNCAGISAIFASIELFLTICTSRNVIGGFGLAFNI